MYYKLTKKEIIPQSEESVVRKDAWIKEVQRTAKSDWEPTIVRVTYEIHNPEVERQRRFFEGPVLDYFAIQNSEIMSGEVPPDLRERYREEVLSDALGYDVKLLHGVARRRRSTTTLTSTQKWHDFIELLRETIFDSNGYEMPDSEAFWALAKQYSVDDARRMAREQLQRRLQAKLGPQDIPNGMQGTHSPT